VDETWREVYLSTAMAENIDGEIDIRASSGAFPMLLVYCKRRGDVNIKVLLSDDQRPITKGLTVADRQYVTMERRLTAVYVGMRETASLPELDPKKPGEATTKIQDMYELWKAELPKGDFIVYTQVFASKAFDDYYIWALKSSHDLSAIVTNVNFQEEKGETLYIPDVSVLDACGFQRKAIKDMRAMISWWHSPESTVSSLPKGFKPDLGTLSWSKEEGFTMNPEFNYGDEDDHEYYVDEGENEWEDDDTGDPDTDDDGTQAAHGSVDAPKSSIDANFSGQTTTGNASTSSLDANFSGQTTTEVPAVPPKRKRKAAAKVAVEDPEEEVGTPIDGAETWS